LEERQRLGPSTTTPDTSVGIGQMLIGIASPYLGAVFGVRRVLLLGITLFFTASLLGHPTDRARGPADPSGTAVRLSLHHPVDRLHHPDLPANRAEFSRRVPG